MVISLFPNEAIFVDDFIDFTRTHPLQVNANDVRHLFVWGHEI